MYIVVYFILFVKKSHSVVYNQFHNGINSFNDIISDRQCYLESGLSKYMCVLYRAISRVDDDFTTNRNARMESHSILLKYIMITNAAEQVFIYF